MEFPHTGKARTMMFTCRTHVVTTFYLLSSCIFQYILFMRNKQFIFCSLLFLFFWSISCLFIEYYLHQLQTLNTCVLHGPWFPLCNQTNPLASSSYIESASSVHFMLAAVMFQSTSPNTLSAHSEFTDILMIVAVWKISMKSTICLDKQSPQRIYFINCRSLIMQIPTYR